MLSKANLDYLHHIAFVDYHLIYEANSVIQLQCYSWGLIRRIEEFAPGTSIEYVPAVVHFPLQVYQTYMKDNPWRKLLDTSDPEIAQALIDKLRRSIANIQRAVYRYERSRTKVLRPFLDMLSDMMQYSSIEEEFNLTGWVDQSLHEHGIEKELIHKLSHPITTPFTAVLLSHAIRSYLSPSYFPLFMKRAGFLRYSAPSGKESSFEGIAYVESVVNGKSKNELLDTLDELSDAVDVRKENRRQALKEITTRAPEIYPVALVCVTLIDHEEARHYWQMRALRDLLYLASERGFNPSTVTLQELSDI